MDGLHHHLEMKLINKQDLFCQQKMDILSINKEQM